MKTDYLVNIYYSTSPWMESASFSSLEESREFLKEKLSLNYWLIKSYKILERTQHLSFKTILEVGN